LRGGLPFYAMAEPQFQAPTSFGISRERNITPTDPMAAAATEPAARTVLDSPLVGSSARRRQTYFRAGKSRNARRRRVLVEGPDSFESRRKLSSSSVRADEALPTPHALEHRSRDASGGSHRADHARSTTSTAHSDTKRGQRTARSPSAGDRCFVHELLLRRTRRRSKREACGPGLRVNARGRTATSE
jgi:hypothetical protein